MGKRSRRSRVKPDFSQPFAVKIQMPLQSSDPGSACLVYNEDRSFFSQTLPANDPLLAVLMDGDLKAYFRVKLVGTKLEMLERLADQDW